MDDPDSDPLLLNKTLNQFEFINRYFLSLRRLTRQIMFPSMLQTSDQPVTILDIGCGGGDFVRWLSEQFDRKGVLVEIVGIDNDPRVFEYAKKSIRNHDNIKVVYGDAFDIEQMEESFDYIFCSNLLHHLSDEEIGRLLPMIMNRCTKGFLAVDLKRSAVSYYLFSIFSAMFLRNSFAQVDGKISIQRGFKSAELEETISKSGILSNPKVKHAGLTDLYFFWKAK